MIHERRPLGVSARAARGAALVRPVAPADNAATLHARLKDQLSAYKLPRHTFFVPSAEIPMTDSGKLDRRKLRDALAKRVAAGEG